MQFTADGFLSTITLELYTIRSLRSYSVQEALWVEMDSQLLGFYLNDFRLSKHSSTTTEKFQG